MTSFGKEPPRDTVMEKFSGWRSGIGNVPRREKVVNVEVYAFWNKAHVRKKEQTSRHSVP